MGTLGQISAQVVGVSPPYDLVVTLSTVATQSFLREQARRAAGLRARHIAARDRRAAWRLGAWVDATSRCRRLRHAAAGGASLRGDARLRSRRQARRHGVESRRAERRGIGQAWTRGLRGARPRTRRSERCECERGRGRDRRGALARHRLLLDHARHQRDRRGEADHRTLPAGEGAGRHQLPEHGGSRRRDQLRRGLSRHGDRDGHDRRPRALGPAAAGDSRRELRAGDALAEPRRLRRGLADAAFGARGGRADHRRRRQGRDSNDREVLHAAGSGGHRGGAAAHDADRRRSRARGRSARPSAGPRTSRSAMPDSSPNSHGSATRTDATFACRFAMRSSTRARSTRSSRRSSRRSPTSSCLSPRPRCRPRCVE